MSDIDHFFWDSCVFIAYLGNQDDTYDVKSISRILEDAKHGKCYIYTSSLTFSEVLPSKIVRQDVGTLDDFLDDLSGIVIPIDADPNVMKVAGALRDLRYRKNGVKRVLDTPDAIQLASCMHLQETFEVPVTAFHTFDRGHKSRAQEGGKTVPLLTYEEWCEECSHDDLARKIIDTARYEPVHAQPSMLDT